MIIVVNTLNLGIEFASFDIGENDEHNYAGHISITGIFATHHDFCDVTALFRPVYL